MRKYPLHSFEDLEKVVNQELNLKETKGSGSVHGNGDGIGKDQDVDTFIQLLAECKYTEKDPASIGVKKSDFEKTTKAAQRYGRIPLMVRGDSSGHAFVVIDLDDFKYLYSLARNKY